jgi:serine-type D-Ala-D-Ala carboxypeptidase (penicillin-binding protein 5/6)
MNALNIYRSLLKNLYLSRSRLKNWFLATAKRSWFKETKELNIKLIGSSLLLNREDFCVTIKANFSVATVIGFFLFSTFSLFARPLEVELQAKNAILLNPENNAILYEKSAREKAYPASITKIATALYILDKKRNLLDEQIKVNPEAIRFISPEKKAISSPNYPSYYLETDGSLVGLIKDEILPGRALFYGLMLSSGNDCANVLAQAASSSIPIFMDELNRYLQSIGCKNTHFSNPHGLHHPDHFTTAYEMAFICKKALSIPQFRQVVSTLSYTASKTNKHKARVLSQYNRLLKKSSKYYYPHAIGVKTGYHSKAGYNLVAAAKVENRILIAVVMGEEKSEQRYEEAIKLFEAAFSQTKEKRPLLDENKLFKARIKGAKGELEAYAKGGLTYEYYPAEEMTIKAVIKWNDLKLPIRKDTLVGEIQIISEDGVVLGKSPLIAKNKIRRNFQQYCIDLFKKIF